MSEQVLFEKFDSIAVIKLNRPEKRNALNPELVREIYNSFEMALKPDIRCVILTGEGNSFCAGADLEYLKQISELNVVENFNDAENLANLYVKIYTFPKITIAMVNGFALAGGCGLASVCDFVIASKENARFGYTEPRIGFVPAIVMYFLLKRINGAKARELLISGNIIDAQEALNIGLANYVVPHEQLFEFTIDFAKNLISEISAESVKFIKEMIPLIQSMRLNDAIEYAKGINAVSRLTEDCKKGLSAFLRKEKIRW